MNLTKTISSCHAIHNAASLPYGRQQIESCIHRTVVIAFARQGFAADGSLRPGATCCWSTRGRAMKPKSSVALVRQSPKSPAGMADPELQHLEKVVRHLCNAGALDTGTSLGLPYWLKRIAEIERRFHLVPPQQQRLRVLRKMLSGEG